MVPGMKAQFGQRHHNLPSFFPYTSKEFAFYFKTNYLIAGELT